ncbi:MAG TPA: adenosylcobinamide-GDP ribazoletransferase [Methanotrichaceae archaeon]|nr:adenosylcobinamide-GDP ribazoletransferase [Methanotrichaceae archaeon]HQJ29439.1 adenosylcobinamide-GDP ribazoletransferase [Methanotrichaceae archaeon]
MRSGFGFLSTIPVGISMEGIESLMRHVYIFPLIGASLGILFAAAALVLGYLLPASMTAIGLLLVIYRICGINHLDGLGDFGDGVTAHGDPEKKIRALKDVYLGSGAALFIIMVILTEFSTLSSIAPSALPWVLVAAEVGAKQAMLTFAAFSAPFHRGFGSIMIEKTNAKHFIAGLAMSAVLCSAALGWQGLVVLMVAAASALYLARVSARNFGGGSGDGIGASNEIARTLALLTALALQSGVTSWMPW